MSPASAGTRKKRAQGLRRGAVVTSSLGPPPFVKLAGQLSGRPAMHLGNVPRISRPENTFSRFVSLRKGLGILLFVYSWIARLCAQVVAGFSWQAPSRVLLSLR